MRIFTALTLSDDFLDALDEAIAPLKQFHREFRWTPRENTHITLAFLGELDNFGVSLLDEVIAQTAANIKPVPVTTTKLLTFPQGKPATVLALDILLVKDRLSMLSSYFEQNLAYAAQNENYSFRPQEKRPHSKSTKYTPHITIARKSTTFITITPEEKALLINLKDVLTSITIFKSELCREGPVYTPLSTHYLTTSK
jgi:2'-5' RNA ligase